MKKRVYNLYKNDFFKSRVVYPMSLTNTNYFNLKNTYMVYDNKILSLTHISYQFYTQIFFIYLCSLHIHFYNISPVYILWWWDCKFFHNWIKTTCHNITFINIYDRTYTTIHMNIIVLCFTQFLSNIPYKYFSINCATS